MNTFPFDITVESSSLQVPKGVWEYYRSGHFNSVAQEMLKSLIGLNLKTFISEDQYEKGKKLREASSGDYCEFTYIEV